MENIIKRFTLRFPIDLYNQIQRLAKQEKRSLHAQILFMLESCIGEKDGIRNTLDN